MKKSSLMVVILTQIITSAFGQNKIYTNYGNAIKASSILKITNDSILYSSPAIYGSFWKGYFSSNSFDDFPYKILINKKYVSKVCITNDSCIKFDKENRLNVFAISDTLQFLRKRTHFYTTGQILNIYHLPKFMVNFSELNNQAKFSKFSYISGNFLMAIGILDILASIGFGIALRDGPEFRINGINGILFLANGIIAREIGKMGAKRTVRKYNYKIKLLSQI